MRELCSLASLENTLRVSTMLHYYICNTLIFIKQIKSYAYDTHVGSCQTCQLKLLTNMCCHAFLMQRVANTYVANTFFQQTCELLLHFFAVLDHVSKNKRNDSVHRVHRLCCTFSLKIVLLLLLLLLSLLLLGFYEWKYTCFTSSKPLCVKQRNQKKGHIFQNLSHLNNPVTLLSGLMLSALSGLR